MFGSFKNWIWMVLCLAALTVFTGCQSGSPLDLNDEALNNPADVNEQGPTVLSEPVLPKDASDWGWFDPGLSQAMIELLFDLQHIPLVSGNNNAIDHTDYMYQSDNVELDGDDVVLKSTATEMSYITYGFKNIPAGEEIVRITVHGTMNTQMFNPSGGLYIGVSDYELGGYRWFGPLGTENEYELNLWNLDTTNDHQRAYVTLAVYGGDHYTIQDVDVKVGTQFQLPEFDWDLVELNDFISPAGYLDLEELAQSFLPGSFWDDLL